MENSKTLAVLVLCIAFLAACAAAAGIFSKNGTGAYEYVSIRGQTVEIYGKGLYRHMSSEVAIQGIAQDYVTLFIGIPALLFTFFRARSGSLKRRFVLAGTLGYFFVTYLFYLAMGMYNALFLVYASLASISMFALALTSVTFDVRGLPAVFSDRAPVRIAGGFLLFNAVSVALLWLSVVVPPLVDGTLYPESLEHYTTLIVQGFDLALLLPVAAVSGILLMRRKPSGYLLVPTYLVFLSFMMAALTAKIIAMALHGYSVIPVVFIIPAFMVISIALSYALVMNISSDADGVDKEAAVC